MKITIYELLGLVKEDKAPKEILYNNRVWKYKEQHKDYYNDMWSLLENQIDVITCYFNDIVEIIKDKEYEDIEPAILRTFERTGQAVTMARLVDYSFHNFEQIEKVINALIRNQKYILEQLSNGATNND